MIQPNPKTASITELRQNATALLRELDETHEPIFILQNSKKAGVLLDQETFEDFLETRENQGGQTDAAYDEKTESYFGRGKGLFGDGLKFQKKIRAEWK